MKMSKYEAVGLTIPVTIGGIAIAMPSLLPSWETTLSLINRWQSALFLTFGFALSWFVWANVYTAREQKLNNALTQALNTLVQYSTPQNGGRSGEPQVSVDPRSTGSPKTQGDQQRPTPPVKKLPSTLPSMHQLDPSYRYEDPVFPGEFTPALAKALAHKTSMVAKPKKKRFGPPVPPTEPPIEPVEPVLFSPMTQSRLSKRQKAPRLEMKPVPPPAPPPEKIKTPPTALETYLKDRGATRTKVLKGKLSKHEEVENASSSSP